MLRISDEQWERIRNHLPEEHISESRPGHKQISTRTMLRELSAIAV
jgi:transposase